MFRQCQAWNIRGARLRKAYIFFKKLPCLLGTIGCIQATVDLPQFMAIARTLWPEVTTADAVAVFRDAHEETSGEVDYQVIHKIS